MKKIKRRAIVAIIGKPNVGKSTLFNRLIGRRLAITSEVAGTTRDRITAQVLWQNMTFSLIDTAGWELALDEHELAINIAHQAEIALQEADLIIFLVDGQGVLDKDDWETAKNIRKTGRPIILVINKAESPQIQSKMSEFYRLGLGEPMLISAIHGMGIAELLDKIIEQLKTAGFKEILGQKEEFPKIALVGRPNVGKSTLLNKIAGEERAVVSDIPGTTRDTIDTKIEIKGETYIFIDTAGLRRRGKIKGGIEKYGVLRALKAIQACDLTVVLIDAQEGAVRGDMHIITYALEAGKNIIVAVNKVDLLPDTSQFLDRFPSLTKIPAVFISAKTGQGIKKLLQEIKYHFSIKVNDYN